MNPTSSALSIVLPAYNEAANIERAVRSTAERVRPLVESYEIVVVDDGSQDETATILKQLQGETEGACAIYCW